MALPQSIRNAGEPWTDQEVAQLKALAADNIPPPVISVRLGRPETAIEGKAAQAGITLNPQHKPPYGG
ncbi:hypothetical protein GCM10009789_48830 [Kribbella sancticallisti]|uniref:Uncharacterized protein n=1 Tax=Kribbella sancticallisti TaxID=460087 RepID=A0ABN2DX49_9ACTN